MIFMQHFFFFCWLIFNPNKYNITCLLSFFCVLIENKFDLWFWLWCFNVIDWKCEELWIRWYCFSIEFNLCVNILLLFFLVIWWWHKKHCFSCCKWRRFQQEVSNCLFVRFSNEVWFLVYSLCDVFLPCMQKMRRIGLGVQAVRFSIFLIKKTWSFCNIFVKTIIYFSKTSKFSTACAPKRIFDFLILKWSIIFCLFTVWFWNHFVKSDTGPTYDLTIGWITSLQKSPSE